MNSVAETELLTQLAALLMPEDVAIEEMFRNFPAPEGWGGNYLEPDLSLFGVLKDENAALFVEYDGSWRHETKEGIERDRMKAALLKYAPPGSCVIRISHTTSKPLKGNALWVKIDTWRRGDVKTLSQVLMDLLVQTESSGLERLLHTRVAHRLNNHTDRDSIKLSASAHQLACKAAVVGGGNTSKEIASFLSAEGFGPKESALLQGQCLSCGMSIERTLQPKIKWFLDLGLPQTQVAKAMATYPQILGYSLEQNLKPTVQWLLGLGLTNSQVAKAVAIHPAFLWLSIGKNLKLTADWLLGLGLTGSQIAKAVATHPQILGLSIKQNLRPTVQWLLDLGLTKSQVAKAVASFPHILGYSIEQNLRPTVQWLLDLGLTKSQVAKAVASFPHILGYSIEQNLRPTVQWLLDLGLTKSQVAKAVASFPHILGYSIEQNLRPTVQWLLDLGLTKSQALKAVASRPQIFGYSLDQNLKPTMRWLLDLGLTKGQVAKVVASFPQILGLSIKQNLKPTVEWLLGFGCRTKLGTLIANWPSLLGYSLESNLEPKARLLEVFCSPQQASEVIASNPEILRFSYKRMAARLTILSDQNQTSKAYYALSLTEDAFERRFLGDQQKCSRSGKKSISWPSSEPSIESFTPVLIETLESEAVHPLRHDHCQCLLMSTLQQTTCSSVA